MAKLTTPITLTDGSWAQIGATGFVGQTLPPVDIELIAAGASGDLAGDETDISHFSGVLANQAWPAPASSAIWFIRCRTATTAAPVVFVYTPTV